MRLLLDVGNTAVKWALAEGRSLGEQGRFAHGDGDFREQALQAWSAIDTPAAIMVASVAGAGMAERITRFAQTRWQLVPEFVQTAQAACGVTNAYHTPADLGVDRWVAMIGAHEVHAGAACIIDCGTAITVDLLSAAGEHRGGLILPGIDMLCRILQADTAGISWQEDAPAGMLLPRGTQAGVSSGATYLAAAAIDRIVVDMTAAVGEGVDALVTGGDAPRLLPLLHVPVVHMPALVLQGLAVMSNGGD